MPRVTWPLAHDCPCVQIVLTVLPAGQALVRTLLADTGAGSRTASFELILDEDDCLHCGGFPGASISLGGAYSGLFPVYDLPVRIPAIAFDRNIRAVGVPTVPQGFDGIAGFAFLSQFTYGNFGDPGQFGLEC